MRKRAEEHSFSVEMKTKGAIKRISYLDKENEQILFEGCLGKLTCIKMVEGVMLEVEGANGTLKLDITQKEIEQCMKPENQFQIEGEQQ